MNEAITLKGIGQAIEGLNYRNKNALKYRLIYTIREFYHDDSSVETLKEIETEKLIGLLWNEANDPAAINHKRKNLNSLKSSINTDLKKLYAEDKNPEGIIIGPNNIFSMSDEAKDNTLKTFLNTVMNEGQANLGEVAKALSAIDKILSDAATHSVDTAKDNLNQLDELKKTIRLMSEKYGGFNHEGSLESAQNNFQNKSSRDGSEQIGTGSEEVSKDGLADKSGYKTDFETDKEAGVGIDQSLPEIVEAIDTIEDDEELEIIEEVESDGLEENIGLGGENGNSIGNNSCEDLSGKENYSTEDGEKYQEPGGIGPGDSSKEGNTGGALSKENIFETETENDIDTGDELELQDEQIDELKEEVEIIDEEIDEVCEDVDIKTEEVDLEENADEVIETENIPDQLLGISDSGSEGTVGDKKGNTGISESDGSDIIISAGAKSGDKDGAEGGETGKGGTSGISSKDNSEQIGTGSEGVSKDGLADKSGYITDFETDKEAGGGTDQSLPDIVEAIDTIDDDEDLEIIEEIEPDSLEENIGLGDGNGNSIGNNSCEDLSGKENYSTEDGEKYQEPGGIGPADSSKEGNAGGALSKDNIFETKTANDIDTGDELELQDEQIDELEEEVEIIDAIDNNEDLEIIEDIEPDGPEENIVLADEYGDSASSDSNAKLVEEDFDIGENKASNIKNAKVLAEEFNHSLAAMDKYYNQYILIQGGSYIIGSKRPKRGECSEEKVNLPDYYIGKYPVINALFEVFAEKTGYKTTAEKRGYSKVYIGRYEKTIDEQTGMEKLIFNATTIQKTVEGACWYQPCGPGSTIHKKRNHPVVHVSFEDAMAFAAWTGKKLPSENEWEAASRTDKGYSLPWGNSFNKKACNIEESSVCGTTPVDRYEEFENNFGIADVLGNVLEWTSSRIEKFMVVKGGSFISGDDVRLFTRFQIEPVNHSNILGFRCMAH
ncbi:MAG: SUMF1/EgtB/PvdO family nonheme iron enzyme [Proteobacteria bacterium]|nr:SUMF1/EgtB/PvdO family nonheme iron enzyme [Pseudomonadota bacterium]